MSVVVVPRQVADRLQEGAGGLVVGVDTHQLTHHAAVVDAAGRHLADREFGVCAGGYRDLLDWARGYGTIASFGVESTGSYGAGLARYLLVEGVDLYEVNRPEKSSRVKDGKSDPVDAYSAAEQVRAGRATARPKITTGIVESLRMLKVPRDGAVKDRTRAYGQLRDLITTAPTGLRDELITLTGKQRVAKVIGSRPDESRLQDPTQSARYALRALARRIRALDQEIAAADKQIAKLTKRACPSLLAMRQVGPQIAAQLVITAGENIDRMRSEAAFAKLAGVAPLPASSGKTNRHRLNPGGDRQANSALYLVIVGRMKDHPETRAYVERRTAQGMSNPEIIRCLKRHLARSIYRALRNDLMTP
jgi:transposase